MIFNKHLKNFFYLEHFSVEAVSMKIIRKDNLTHDKIINYANLYSLFTYKPSVIYLFWKIGVPQLII